MHIAFQKGKEREFSYNIIAQWNPNNGNEYQQWESV